MRILIVDDHHLIREGVRPLLQKLAAPRETVEVVEAPDFRGAVTEIAKNADFDLVLLDLGLPDTEGFAALEELQWRCPSSPVIIMSGEDDPERVRQGLARGALGYIPKSSPPAVILGALKLVLAGGTYIPPEGIAAPAPALNLTTRQADVLALLIAGKSNKEICRDLALAEGTVKTHIAAIFRALNVTTRVQAVVAAGKLGIK